MPLSDCFDKELCVKQAGGDREERQDPRRHLEQGGKGEEGNAVMEVCILLIHIEATAWYAPWIIQLGKGKGKKRLVEFQPLFDSISIDAATVSY